jgi:hypothetical protein
MEPIQSLSAGNKRKKSDEVEDDVLSDLDDDVDPDQEDLL